MELGLFFFVTVLFQFSSECYYIIFLFILYVLFIYFSRSIEVTGERGASFILEKLSQTVKHINNTCVMVMILRLYLHITNSWKGTLDIEISMESLRR